MKKRRSMTRTGFSTVKGKAGILVWMLAGLMHSPAANANVIGSSTQNFVPTADGLDFVTVHSSRTLRTGYFNLGLFWNHAVNTLPFSNDDTGRTGKARDQISAVDFSAGYGIFRNVEVTMGVPNVLTQNVESDDLRGEFDQTGITELRLGLKTRLAGSRRGGIALAASYNHNLIANNPFIGEGGGNTWNLEAIGDRRFGRLATGLNLGYRMRDPGEQTPEFANIVEPTGDEYVMSTAVSWLFTSLDTKLIGEVYGSRPVQSPEIYSKRGASTAEALVGLKHDLTNELALHGGTATEIIHGTSSPDLRIYAGLNWSGGGDDRRPTLTRKKKRRHRVRRPQRPRRMAPAPAPQAEPEEFPEPVMEEEPPRAMAGPPHQLENEIEAARAEPDIGGDEVFVLRNVNFFFDSSERVLPGSRAILKTLADYLKTKNVRSVTIEGHTDSIGSHAYNEDLGKRRANAVRRHLMRVERLPGNVLQTVSFGERVPVATNGNYQGRQLNRRVVFRVYYVK